MSFITDSLPIWLQGRGSKQPAKNSYVVDHQSAPKAEPVSQMLRDLQDDVGDWLEEPADVNLEREYNTYKIADFPNSPSSLSTIIINLMIGFAIALLMMWLLWPEELQPQQQVDQQTVIVEVSEISASKVATDVIDEVLSEPVLTVSVSFGNVRSAPSAKADVLFQLKQGDIVYKLDEKWGWYQVRLQNGAIVWAYQSLFSQQS